MNQAIKCEQCGKAGEKTEVGLYERLPNGWLYEAHFDRMPDEFMCSDECVAARSEAEKIQRAWQHEVREGQAKTNQQLQKAFAEARAAEVEARKLAEAAAEPAMVAKFGSDWRAKGGIE